MGEDETLAPLTLILKLSLATEFFMFSPHAAAEARQAWSPDGLLCFSGVSQINVSFG